MQFYFINIPGIFRIFFREKLLQLFSLFREKNRCKKVRKKYGLKTPTFGQNWAAIQWNFGRITNFLPFTSKCLPQKCSLFLKSQFTPTFSLILYSKKHFKRLLLPIYGITYFSRFFALSRKIVLFFRFSRKK